METSQCRLSQNYAAGLDHERVTGLQFQCTCFLLQQISTVGAALSRQLSSHVCAILQDAFLEEYKLPIAACKMFSLKNHSSASSKDYYKDGFQSLNNLLCQLNSLQEVTSMWKSSGHDYHAVLYLRPDILYNCPFPTVALDSLETGSVYIADFHHWHGYNDRFAMGRPDTVGLWGDRYGSM